MSCPSVYFNQSLILIKYISHLDSNHFSIVLFMLDIQPNYTFMQGLVSWVLVYVYNKTYKPLRFIHEVMT